MWNRVLEDYAVQKLQEFLEDTLIAEVAIEVMEDNKTNRDVTLYSVQLRGDIEYIDNLMGKVVKQMAKDTVHQVIDSMVHR